MAKVQLEENFHRENKLSHALPMEQVFKVGQNIHFHPNCNSFVFQGKMNTTGMALLRLIEDN
jgi:hypothetical protein